MFRRDVARRVEQIVYLQNDFTAYKIGNIMFNLANSVASAGAPMQIQDRRLA